MQLTRAFIVVVALLCKNAFAQSGLPISNTDDLPNQIQNNIEVELIGSHPSAYFVLASQEWSQGKRDDAVFWFYVGQLRFRFYLAANPNLEPSGDSALLASFMYTLGEPLNQYAGSDLDKLRLTIDRALEWDAAHPNTFTSKELHKAELASVRDDFKRLSDELNNNREEIVQQREQLGLGTIGVIDGTYVEERNEKMPTDWPALLPKTSLQKLAGSYEASSDSLLGPILFFSDQYKVLDADLFTFTVTEPSSLLVVAEKIDENGKHIELLRRVLLVHEEANGIAFVESHLADEVGLVDGGEKETVIFRKNIAGELVIQRTSTTEGHHEGKPIPVRLTYTFWNRANSIHR